MSGTLMLICGDHNMLQLKVTLYTHCADIVSQRLDYFYSCLNIIVHPVRE